MLKYWPNKEIGNEDQTRENGHNKTKHGIVTCILRSHQVSQEKGC